jgi:hypothetical protein
LAALVLSETERSELLSLAARRSTAQALALRARIVLGCAEGKQNKEIADRLRVDQPKREDAVGHKARCRAISTDQAWGVKRVCYLSMEFLPGRVLVHALMNLGLYESCRRTLAEHGLDLDEIAEIEAEPALGNGGLGRLAACRRGTATGFAFEGVNSADMLHCIERALALYAQPFAWRRVQRQVMAQDFGWADSARRYLAIYLDLAPDAAAISDAMTDDPVPEKASG